MSDISTHFRDVIPTGFRVRILDTKDSPEYGETLAQWRERHGGYEGQVSFINGETYPLSLAPFAHLDPLHTFVAIEMLSSVPAEVRAENAKKPPTPFTSMGIYSYPVSPADIRTPLPITKLHRGVVRLIPPALVYTIGPDGSVNGDSPKDGWTLAAYRDALGGETGMVIDQYTGQAHLLSLAIYACMDAETTYVRVGIEFTPEGHAEAVAERRRLNSDHVPRNTPSDDGLDDNQSSEGGAG